MIKTFLKSAAAVSTMWSLAAFSIAAILYLATRKRQGATRGIVIAAMLAIVVLGVLPIVGHLYVDVLKNGPSIYQLRAIVLDAHQTPIEDANVWSSLGGEPKKVAGGWQFDIPSASLPVDRKLTIYATASSSFLKGQVQVTLGGDFHPSITISLTRTEGIIRGIVID